MPELAALEMLIAISETTSLSGAARAMGLTQQAVSARLRALEAQVGTPLVLRGPRGTKLTEHGHLLVTWAREVLIAAERMDAGLASLRGDAQRHLKVIASQTIAEYLLPMWLVTLRQRQMQRNDTPTIIELTVGNSEQVLAGVRAGTAPIGFIESPLPPEDLPHAVVQYDELLVVVAPKHAWARRTRSLTLAELAETPLVTREPGSGTRAAYDHALEVNHYEPVTPLVEYATTAAVKSAACAGTAPAVLSHRAVADDIRLGRLIAIPCLNTRLKRPLHAVWLTGRTPPPGPARDLISIAAAGATSRDTWQAL